MNRHWNTVAGVGGTVTIAYIVILGLSLQFGTLSASDFAAFVLPVVTPWIALVGFIIRGKDE